MLEYILMREQSDMHSIKTKINILYPFHLALALYIMNYSTRA